MKKENTGRCGYFLLKRNSTKKNCLNNILNLLYLVLFVTKEFVNKSNDIINSIEIA
jgi:hypothetical protein